MSRYVHFTSRLTGWNAIKSRCEQLGLAMTDAQVKQCTVKIKALGDVRKLAMEDTDGIINAFYKNLSSQVEQPLLEGLTEKEEKEFVKKEQELASVPEKRKIDEVADAEAKVPMNKKKSTQTVS